MGPKARKGSSAMVSQNQPTPYQLLPPLTPDEYDRLYELIRKHGVLESIVVDEDGNVIDGHHRLAIATELGIECPRVVQAGLAEHEKRILAAGLNCARRELTDAQKVLLGRQIEPDIAARARERQAHGLTAPGRNAGGQLSTSEKTRDEVARTVGIGSGRTYERHKQVLTELEQEPDDPHLMKHVESGDWEMRDVIDELRRRRGDSPDKPSPLADDTAAGVDYEDIQEIIQRRPDIAAQLLNDHIQEIGRNPALTSQVRQVFEDHHPVPDMRHEPVSDIQRLLLVDFVGAIHAYIQRQTGPLNRFLDYLKSREELDEIDNLNLDHADETLTKCQSMIGDIREHLFRARRVDYDGEFRRLVNREGE